MKGCWITIENMFVILFNKTTQMKHWNTSVSKDNMFIKLSNKITLNKLEATLQLKKLEVHWKINRQPLDFSSVKMYHW